MASHDFNDRSPVQNEHPKSPLNTKLHQMNEISHEDGIIIAADEDSCTCNKKLHNKGLGFERQEENVVQYKYNGSDSGIEVSSTIHSSPMQSKTPKSNSSDFVAINNQELGELIQNCNISCDSSMISNNSSDLSEVKAISTPPPLNTATNYSCSENGSESSSIANGLISKKINSNSKKKFDLLESSTYSTKSSVLKNKNAGHVLNVKASVAETFHKTLSVNARCNERARSREKCNKESSTSCNKNSTPSNRSTPVRLKPQKPNFLPSALDTAPATYRSANGTPTIARARTPGTPSDDGRWPSVGGRGHFSAPFKRGISATPELNNTVKQRGNIVLEGKCSPLTNPYGTLPRRRKQKSYEDLNKPNSRSTSKENRLIASVLIPSSQKTPPLATMPTREAFSSLKCNRKLLPKTTIYHETSVQTALTSHDMENIFAGSHSIPVDIGIERIEKETQSDMRDDEIQGMENEIRKLINQETELNYKLKEKAQKISNLELQLTKEREEKKSLQKEMQQNTERVLGILDRARRTPTREGNCDSLLMLESTMQISGNELIEKQEEISKLRKVCRTLQAEVKRCLIAQENLIQEKASLEKEATELQDFLQHEKHAMYDALKDIEHECQSIKRINNDKDEEIKVLRDECRHLVRLNEQRRQENKLMQSKYSALERKSKDLIAQQNAAVSGASMALSGLHTRLHNLVEQLVTSYNISEQDLEDVVFQTEPCLNSGSSFEGTPEREKLIVKSTEKQQHENGEGSLSPQRNQSFLTAVINAIRNATTQSGKKLRSRHRNPLQVDPANDDESDSTEMLDSETEPCLMMDNVLEDVPINDSHSQNLVSSTGMLSQMEIVSEFENVGDDSLHNLSQAIKNRQQIEMQIHKISVQYSEHESSVSEDISYVGSAAEMPSLIDYCPGQAVVDQVIEVDNVITKLLKVLRLIQMDNDNCIQQLILDKNKLQQNKEDMLEKFKDLQEINIKLQDELMDATQELMLKGNDISSTKAEMQRHRNEIDRIAEDIYILSTKCNANSQNQSTIKVNKIDINNGILSLLKIWHGQGYLKEPSILEFMSFICREIPANTNEKRKNIISDHHQEIQCCDQIDRVLTVLMSVKIIVDETPKLQQLQLNIGRTPSTYAFSSFISAAVTALSSFQKCTNTVYGIGMGKTESMENTVVDMNANSPKRINLIEQSLQLN